MGRATKLSSRFFNNSIRSCWTNDLRQSHHAHLKWKRTTIHQQRRWNSKWCTRVGKKDEANDEKNKKKRVQKTNGKCEDEILNAHIHTIKSRKCITAMTTAIVFRSQITRFQTTNEATMKRNVKRWEPYWLCEATGWIVCVVSWPLQRFGFFGHTKERKFSSFFCCCYPGRDNDTALTSEEDNSWHKSSATFQRISFISFSYDKNKSKEMAFPKPAKLNDVGCRHKTESTERIYPQYLTSLHEERERERESARAKWVQTNEPPEYNTNTLRLFIPLLIVTKDVVVPTSKEVQITFLNCVHICD